MSLLKRGQRGLRERLWLESQDTDDEAGDYPVTDFHLISPFGPMNDCRVDSN
jgi:hypothetical protein